MSRRIVVIGGGIVGAALAAALTDTGTVTVTALERGPRVPIRGSTGHAPGFVGLFNEVPIMTDLERTSAHAYEPLQRGGSAGFDRIGCLRRAKRLAGDAGEASVLPPVYRPRAE